MLYIGNIHLSDDFAYICVHCTYQHKINRDPQALMSITADFFACRLFSRFFRLAAPEATHLKLSGQDRHVPP